MAEKSIERRPGVVLLKGTVSSRPATDAGPSYGYPPNGLPPMEDASLTIEEREFAKKTSFLLARPSS